MVSFWFLMVSFLSAFGFLRVYFSQDGCLHGSDVSKMFTHANKRVTLSYFGIFWCIYSLHNHFLTNHSGYLFYLAPLTLVSTKSGSNIFTFSLVSIYFIINTEANDAYCAR